MTGSHLRALAGRLAVARLEPGAAIPEWALAASGGLFSVTRTSEELSILCSEEAVPSGVRAERGFRALGVIGPIDFAQVGVLAAIVGPLAAAGVSLFAISTYDTDYILVKEERLETALQVLAASGHVIEP